jgi:hypothetical protein
MRILVGVPAVCCVAVKRLTAWLAGVHINAAEPRPAAQAGSWWADVCDILIGNEVAPGLAVEGLVVRQSVAAGANPRDWRGVRQAGSRGGAACSSWARTWAWQWLHSSIWKEESIALDCC